MLQTAEGYPSSFLPSRELLLQRPHHDGAAIDPKHPVEIDDAIKVVELNDTDRLVLVHVADGGLLEGTPHVDSARKQGWTEYRKHGGDKLQLPIDVVQQLNLTNKAEVGVPAVTIAFEFNEEFGIGATEVHKSRVTVKQFSYDSYLKMLRKGKPEAELLRGTAHQIKRSLGLQSMSREYYMQDIVAKYMVAANMIIATYMDKDDQYPWLFRNHGGAVYQQITDDKKRSVFEQMKIALYGPSPFMHEGVGAQKYCHFTSPLRRFADLANHVNLTAKLEGRDPAYSEHDMQEIANELTALHVARSAAIGRKLAA